MALSDSAGFDHGPFLLSCMSWCRRKHPFPEINELGASDGEFGPSFLEEFNALIHPSCELYLDILDMDKRALP